MPKDTKSWKSFGQRIQAIRDEHGLSLEDLAHEIGYPSDILKEIEEDIIVPPVSLVIQLSHIFKIDVDQLENPDEKKASRRRLKSHKKRVDSYAYTPLSRPGSDKHLRAYLVTIDPEAQHKGVEYHHDGEEFVYVLKGCLTIQIGDNVTKLDEGGFIHFNSALHHKLSNPSTQTTELLVTVYIP
ncbi:MAG: cupin domain-containing protein [Thermodesulfobacteriota bacterium]|nr:cupin domain-containing protein [Thermodesulfobacteriota bacterium]